MSNDNSWLRFADLKRMKLVTNHVTLKRWIEQEGFPPGLMLGPNTRGWRKSDVEAWLGAWSNKECLQAWHCPQNSGEG